MIYDIKTNESKPKWYEVRKKLSNICLWLAKKLYPENPAVKAFFMKQITDMAIYGGSIAHIDYTKINKIHDKGNN